MSSGAAAASGDVYTWTGAGATASWSDPANWSCSGPDCASVASANPITDSQSDVILPAAPASGVYSTTLDAAADLNTLTIDSDLYYIGGHAALTVDGAASLDGQITTGDQPQTYNGPVTVAPNMVLVASNAPVTFNSTVDGTNGDLELQARFAFNAPVGATEPLNEILDFGGLPSTIDTGQITAVSGIVLDGTVTLGTDTALTADRVSVGDLEGPHSLSITGNATFAGPVGTAASLTSIAVSGSTTMQSSHLAATHIATTGPQTYDGVVQLVDAFELDSSNVTMTGALSGGGNPLTVDGPVTFADGASGLIGLSVSGNTTITGGTFQAPGSGATFDLGGDLDVAGGTFDAHGGTVNFDGTNGPQQINGMSVAFSDLNVAQGSTLDLTGHSTSALDLTGDGTIDNTGSASTLTLTPSSSDTFPGAVEGPTSLVVNGSGTLSLSGTNGYTGSTDVDSGTLVVSGTVAGPVTVDHGSLSCLNGTLSDGPVTNDGGSLSGAPDAPTAVSATPGGGQATVSFTPGSANCYPLSAYRVTAYPGGRTATGDSSPITVTGLSDNTAYRFVVTETNPIGSTNSQPSTSVTTDGDPPTASIEAPRAGGVYVLDQTVRTRFSCSDAADGPGIASCTDSNGATGGAGTLNASSPGLHSYVVTAVSKDGRTARSTLSYRVVLPPNRFRVRPVRKHHPVVNGCGVARLKLTLPWGGLVKSSERQGSKVLARAHRLIPRAESTILRIAPGRGATRVLLGGGRRHTIKLQVTFTPAHGIPRTITIRGIRLRGRCVSESA